MKKEIFIYDSAFIDSTERKASGCQIWIDVPSKEAHIINKNEERIDD